MSNATNINMEEFFEKEEQAFKDYKDEVSALEVATDEVETLEVKSKNSFVFTPEILTKIKKIDKASVRNLSKSLVKFSLISLAPIVLAFVFTFLGFDGVGLIIAFSSFAVIGTGIIKLNFAETEATKAKGQILKEVPTLVEAQVVGSPAYKKLMSEILNNDFIIEALQNPRRTVSSQLETVPGLEGKNIVLTYDDVSRRMSFKFEAIERDSYDATAKQNRELIHEEL